jgi:hypothetical protein
MKCKECKYYNTDDACTHCDYKTCQEDRKRKGMDTGTCVWNCTFCVKHKEYSNTEK